MYLDADGCFVIFEGERDRRLVILVKNTNMFDFFKDYNDFYGRFPQINSLFELSDREFEALIREGFYDNVFDGE